MSNRTRRKRNGQTSAANELIASADFETDPFKYGRIPRPFVAGFFEPSLGYHEFWGDDCAMQLVAYIATIKTPLRIYFHNGGKFDFFLMTEHLENPLKIINGRIVKAKCGIHTLQDSFAFVPVGLAKFDKDEIDYSLLESDKRDAHRDEISRYLKKDCTSLYNVVSKFRERFGDQLTIGATALKELRKIHDFPNCNASHDERFRPFYFGGRVEFFERGVLIGNWKIYDVNSMYPHVMANFTHPCGPIYSHKIGGIIDKRGNIAQFADSEVYFARISCKQRGAFAVRVKDEPLNFSVPEGEFYVTSHELKTALELGLVSDLKLIEAWVPQTTIRFDEFVSTWSLEKEIAGKSGDKAGREFAKLIQNSAYGKTAQNPENYFDFYLCRAGEFPPSENAKGDSVEWEIYSSIVGGAKIWRAKAPSKVYYDVAIAASITGAARAVLMRAMHHAKRPIYCDTDSLICESLDDNIDDHKLGAWKIECVGDKVCIAGKKLYAVTSNGKTVKLASKGAKLTSRQIEYICKGKTLHYHNKAPTFSIAGEPKFLKRKIKAT